MKRILIGCVVAATCVATGCGKKDGGGGGGSGGEDWAWNVAPTELKAKYGAGEIVFKGNLPTGWEQKDAMGGVRLSMPEQNGMINASLDLGPSMRANKAKEAASDPVDPSYTAVDPPKEIMPGRWSRVLLEPGGMSANRVRYDVGVFWEVGPATLRCSVRVVGPKDNPKVWQQALDACTSVEATVPAT